jgi:hypothetical protein
MNIKENVEDTVARLVKDNSMFTIFDITKTLRGLFDIAGQPPKIKHYIVKQEFENIDPSILSSYNKALVDIGGNMARVYFPMNSDPNTYNSNWIEDGINSKSIQTIHNAPANVLVAAILKPTSNGRLNIGKEWLSQIGLKINDPAFVSIDNINNSIVIEKSDSGVSKDKYYVDQEHRIRLSYMCYDQISHDGSFDIKNESGKLVIKGN